MSEEEQEPSQENPDAEAVVEQPTEVTRAQWASIFLLIALSIYLFFIWPSTASHKSNLKEPEVYLDLGRKLFSEAHHDKAFPFGTRINTFQEAAWAYSQARIAEGSLGIQDLYEWGMSRFTVAKVTHPGSSYAMVEPIELFEEALELAETERVKAMAEGGVDAAREAVESLDVHPAKIRYRLGLSYLEAGRVDKAKPLLEYIRDLRLRYDQYQRMRDRKVLGKHLHPPITLDASPYMLQQGELYEVEWLLGRAKQITGDHLGAITSLEDYLESTRSEGVSSGSSRESRFNALKLLCKIHMERVHDLEGELRVMRGQLDFSSRYKKVEAELQSHLDQVSARYDNLFTPEYSVFGLEELSLRRAEVAYKRGETQKALNIAFSYKTANPHLRNEMKLWKTLALLKNNLNADVIPTLNAIAGDNTRRHLRLAALVILGDTQVRRGEIDDALGVLLPSNKDILYRPSIGAYERAATQFEEKEFDESRMINKFTLIESIKRRAHKAENDENEDDAIRLYKFLLKYFTVPVASIKQGVAHLQRLKAQKIFAKEDMPKHHMGKEARKWFKESAETYLASDDPQKVDFEREASRHALFEAAESYFEGGYYTKAYETYGKFISDREDDVRVSQARHKRGVSALFRKKSPELLIAKAYEHDRFQDARNEFFANISRDLRPIEDNKTLDHTMLLDGEKENIRSALEEASKKSDILSEKDIESEAKAIGRSISNHPLIPMPSDNQLISMARIKLMDFKVEEELLDDLLSKTDTGSRDLWAYHSLLELGLAYYAEHRYEQAEKVFERIKNDRRFSPSSEPWRKAAYAHAQMTYDRIFQNKGEYDWNQAVRPLEDLLRLYDISHFDKRFPSTDIELKATIRRENAKAQVNLATAQLLTEEPEKALSLLDELLMDQARFDISIPKGSSESQEFCTTQKVQALKGDALFDLKRYEEAMESYRRAHDRNLKSYERPMYSLNIVDCLIGLGRKEEAMERLKRTSWEFKEFFSPDSVVMTESPAFSKEGWQSMIDFRMNQLTR